MGSTFVYFLTASMPNISTRTRVNLFKILHVKMERIFLKFDILDFYKPFKILPRQFQACKWRAEKGQYLIIYEFITLTVKSLKLILFFYSYPMTTNHYKAFWTRIDLHQRNVKVINITLTLLHCYKIFNLYFII